MEKDGSMYRRADDIIDSKCLCGSAKLTKYCCARPEGVIFKEPLVIKETKTHIQYQNKKCLFAHRSTCSPKTSREHYISRSVLHLLNKTGIKTLTVSGIADVDESKSIAIKGMTAKILCKHHNEMFSRLDSEAYRLAQAIQSHFQPGDDHEYLFSGHDLERWLFKVSLGMHAGGIFNPTLMKAFF
jgi:hypothetical protein